jgi:hypothetical protein
MGVLLSQLPPAELARLKAELAETLIANFCYPRFFDYRTESLRMRPVDRAKRQEVWHYLNSVDLSAWSRLDLMSPDFQGQIERLFIQFVQRNRAFFGEQGRKRMSDIRMLINTSAMSVVQGLRAHLTTRDRANSHFGGPRPPVLWSAPNAHVGPEPAWEQVAPATMVLQQQLQEVRGEIKPPDSEARTTSGAARRPGQVPPLASLANGIEQPGTSVPPVPARRQAPQTNARSAMPLPEPKSTTPLSPAWTTTPIPTPAATSAPTSKLNPVVDPPETPTAIPPVPPKPIEKVNPEVPLPEQTPFPAPAAAQPRDMPPPAQAMAVRQSENTSVLVSEEDVAIFEQLRHQLMVWLRIEAVRSGMDISGQGPSQLLEQLRQQDNFDETRLQVVSTLLNLSNQVIKNGHATLLDYKQAMMFHLMHTRRS